MTHPNGFRPRGFVFDLDGTLVANMGLHEQAFAVFNERHGLPRMGAEMRARLDGKRNRDIFPILFDRTLAAEDLRRYADEKEGIYRELSRGRLSPVSGLLRLLDRIDEWRLPVVLATSAPEENVRHTLGELALADRLRAVVRSDTVPHGKPHPDVFLAAARLIEVPPSECVAFEDAPSGIVAARAAGMTCVAVTTTFAASVFEAHGARPDLAVSNFDEYLAGAGAWLLGDRR
jgi:HAD superfamily hydrolase (TIGR01509 family)